MNKLDFPIHLDITREKEPPPANINKPILETSLNVVFNPIYKS